jgi:cytochrome b involved in lipid metabolism
MALNRLVYAAFIAFLAGVATILILAALSPEHSQPGRANDRAISAAELARHASAQDCWMAIEGGVYDLTGYIALHPAAARVLIEWCGKEATAAFRTKGYSRPHSPAARALLPRYRIGTAASI